MLDIRQVADIINPPEGEESPKDVARRVAAARVWLRRRGVSSVGAELRGGRPVQVWAEDVVRAEVARRVPLGLAGLSPERRREVALRGWAGRARSSG